ncbi:hypothetical protein NX059_008732 [Plenodomus lindquistii]|nr:hypothetical protein NX059_008732 [Plenodomus lindquistii]
MIYTRLCLVVTVSLMGLARSQGAQDDPINSFCRRWGHSTARVDSRLYIDGGMVGNMPFKSNYSNDYLLFSDLTIQGSDGMPPQSNNLTKPKNVPSVSGGYIWADNTNKCFYQFGGEYPQGPPTDFSMWTYDVLLDQWNSTATHGEKSPQRVSYGAGTQVEDRGFGFYFGGWLNNNTTPDWEGPSLATGGLMRFDFNTGELKNISGPDDSGRAEGHLTYLPVSDAGILMYFGGIEDQYRNGTSVAANMTSIHIFDLASSKWYTQTASGDVPSSRRQFCADVTWPDDQSSFNIYVYGGYGFGEYPAFDDVYILSIPSFKWVKAFPEGDVPASDVGHGGCTANVINHDQMIPGSAHFNGGDKKLWDKFDPNLTNYVVPTPLISAIGGGPTGGATVTAPPTWDHRDLATYYTLRPSFSARAATRLIPSTTGSPFTNGSKRSNVATIAGGTVGGLLGAVSILLLVLFCLHRRKKVRKEEQTAEHPPVLPPTELPVTAFPHEMSSSSAAGKYIAMHERSPYSGTAQLHSEAINNDGYTTQHLPSYGFVSPSTDRTFVPPSTRAQYGSYQGDGSNQMSNSNGTAQFVSPMWDRQSNVSATSPRQYSYPTPTSPERSSLDLPIQRPPQTYYPPPVLPKEFSAAETQDRRDMQHPSITRTSTTPAQFYGKSAPGPQVDSGSTRSRTPTGRNVQSRFVEAEYM